MASILIVDDEEGLLASLIQAFALRGYQATGAGSGAEALKLLERAAFDVVLADVRLPDIDGISLMHRVRAHAPAMVVILMTGGATVESAVHALRGGAYDYILKPFSLEEILRTVERGLELQRLRRENLELGELNCRLQDIDRIKSNLLAAITHEFRTPLTVIQGWMDLLLSRHLGELSLRQRESLGAARKGALRLGRLIANLLVYVESAPGGGTGARAPVQIDEVLQQAITDLESEAEEQGVRISRPGVPVWAIVLGDPERLRLLFFNLLENAVKFNQPGGEVRMSASAEEGWLEETITNTRGEMPAEFLPQLWRPFTQGDMSATRAVRGLGLGLAAVRTILDAHAGHLGVESDRGAGTTVRVRLPLSAAEGSPRELPT